jgi:hypothetical protein
MSLVGRHSRGRGHEVAVADGLALPFRDACFVCPGMEKRPGAVFSLGASSHNQTTGDHGNPFAAGAADRTCVLDLAIPLSNEFRAVATVAGLRHLHSGDSSHVDSGKANCCHSGMVSEPRGISHCVHLTIISFGRQLPPY